MSYKEDREWNDRFGESYLDRDNPEEELDEEQIDRLEEEFLQDLDDPESPHSDYGDLDEMDEAGGTAGKENADSSDSAS